MAAVSVIAVFTFPGEAEGMTSSFSKAHLVVVNRGVAGVSLGDSAARVRNRLGAPDSSKPRCGGLTRERSRGCVVWKYRSTKREIAIAHDKVVYIVLNSARDHSATGIRMGAPRSTVDMAYPGCPSDHAYCILTGRGTSDYPTSRQRMTLVTFDGENETISRFVIAVYGSKYLGCVFGCL